MTNKVSQLKDALLDELILQVKDGIVIQKEDEVIRLSPPSAVLAVAAKVVKDLADEGGEEVVKKSEQLSEQLKRYANRKGLSVVQ